MLSGNLERQPLTVFFKEAVLRSPAGWIWLGTTAAYLILAALSLILPTLVLDDPARQGVALVVFFGWPIMSGLGFVMVCGPHYNVSIPRTACAAILAMTGFWLIYW